MRRVCGDKVSLLATDEHPGYAAIWDTYNHGLVKHSAIPDNAQHPMPIIPDLQHFEGNDTWDEP